MLFDRDGLKLRLLEDGAGNVWELRFSEVQACACTTEESSSSVVSLLPSSGAFFEFIDSPWLEKLGRGRLEYMARSRHFVLCCQDEVIEVAATSDAVCEEVGPGQ